jgi:hypothetical protein
LAPRSIGADCPLDNPLLPALFGDAKEVFAKNPTDIVIRISVRQHELDDSGKRLRANDIALPRNGRLCDRFGQPARA